ncbi:hypothetical protein CPC16_009236 [Podila verticillata]|nr:hypothetical protein CPC16_009236 [Podila verticillata]
MAGLSPASNHSYSALNMNDPDEVMASSTNHHRTSSQAESIHSTSDGIETIPHHIHSPSQELTRRRIESHEGSKPDIESASTSSALRIHNNYGSSNPIRPKRDRDDENSATPGEPFVKSTHWSRCWIRYVALACILFALALLTTLLVLRPWQRKHRMAPVDNEAVKALPAEQPLWPIPTSFTYGKNSVVLSSDFTIKVRVGNQQTPLASLKNYPIIEKAVARCMGRLAVKRNTTRPDASLDSNRGQGSNVLSELVIAVNNPEAELEYGAVESYILNVTFLPTTGSSFVAMAVNQHDILNKREDEHQHADVLARQSAIAVTGISSAFLSTETQWGILHGLETFTQLVRSRASSSSSAAGGDIVNTLEVPNAPWSINDAPRYSHRGLLLDTSRHYFPVADIIRTLDAMSTVKLNVFHWHVLDQQSYPLVSQRYPDLTAKGAERPDRIYSLEDVASIIRFGEERGIRVLPEFDAPGHTASWGRAYPNITVCVDALPHSSYAAEPPAGQLDPLEPFTYSVLDGLVKEWAAQFPDKHVHIGGDEINFNCWKTSQKLKDYIDNPGKRQELESKLPPVLPEGQDKMRQTRSGSQSGEDKLLQVYLDRAIGMYLNQKKIPIVWEEMALEHNIQLPESTIVQVWKNAGNAKKIIEQGRPVILSSVEYWYLDCGSGDWLVGSQGQSWCGFTNWQRVYSYSLTDKLTPEQQKMVYGGEICMWAEQTDSSNLDSNLWPRSAAAAEVLWSGSHDSEGELRPLLQAARRLSAVRERLVEMGVRAAPIFPSWCSKHPEACLKE